MGAGLALAALQVGKSVWDLFQNGKQRRQNTAMVNETGEYQADPNMDQNLSLARSLFNARAAGAASAEQSILSNQATATGSVERNATDAAQALSVIEGVNNNTNNAVAQLQQSEAVDQQRRFGQLQNAVSMKNAEVGKVWADKLRKLNMRLGINNTYHQNLNNAVGGITDGLGMAATSIDKDGKDMISLLFGKK